MEIPGNFNIIRNTHLDFTANVVVVVVVVVDVDVVVDVAVSTR
jgi:hypothetical protein